MLDKLDRFLTAVWKARVNVGRVTKTAFNDIDEVTALDTKQITRHYNL